MIDHNFHLNNSKKNFIQINIELMNEINREIKNYEHKIHNLRAYSENAQTKNDASTNDLLMYYHEDVDNTDDSLLNENNFNYNMKHKKYNDRSTKTPNNSCGMINPFPISAINLHIS